MRRCSGLVFFQGWAEYARGAERRDVKEDLDSAQRYRQRAEELRSIAAETKERSSQQVLLDIAEDYERMARSRDRIDQMDRQLKYTISR